MSAYCSEWKTPTTKTQIIIKPQIIDYTCLLQTLKKMILTFPSTSFSFVCEKFAAQIHAKGCKLILL